MIMGVDISVIESRVRAQKVEMTEDELRVELEDGRTISVPLAWFPRLRYGTPAERERWEFIGNGEGIHWPELDEDIKVAHLLAGIPSRESRKSLQRWLAERRKRQKVSA